MRSAAGSPLGRVINQPECFHFAIGSSSKGQWQSGSLARHPWLSFPAHLIQWLCYANIKGILLDMFLPPTNISSVIMQWFHEKRLPRPQQPAQWLGTKTISNFCKDTEPYPGCNGKVGVNLELLFSFFSILLIFSLSYLHFVFFLDSGCAVLVVCM